jgi:hypothetical protein
VNYGVLYEGIRECHEGQMERGAATGLVHEYGGSLEDSVLCLA